MFLLLWVDAGTESQKQRWGNPGRLSGVSVPGTRNGFRGLYLMHVSEVTSCRAHVRISLTSECSFNNRFVRWRGDRRSALAPDPRSLGRLRAQLGEAVRVAR